ncbi:hypothetical protein HanPI659440_Chr11g0406331 [Helianthus annuus]|nr:hypothetical protein HanPI659440_Chr11g0406331 [Helianthus annuus]
MASKINESSSTATAPTDILFCKWGVTSFNNLVHDYGIRAEWNPVLPSKTDTAFPLKVGKITLFSDFFKFCNFRLPITKFLKSVLDFYRIHISQIHPLGLVKLRQFEYACIALGHIPELVVFRAFFVLVWKSPFFTFDRRDTDASCLRDIPTSSRDKDWKKKFFYLDAAVIPGEMHLREKGPKDKVRDDAPPEDAYASNVLYIKLCGRPFECTIIPEGALVMAGMSLLWPDIKRYPSFQRDDTGEWGMFDFIDPPRHLALKPADRVLDEGEPDVLRVHLEQFLLPAIPADPTAYVTPLSGVAITAVSVSEKKPARIKLTGKKHTAIHGGVPSVEETSSVGRDVPLVTDLTSPSRASKKRKTFVVPTLSAFEAVQAACAFPTGTSVGVPSGVVIPTLVPTVALSCPGSSVSMSTSPKTSASVTAAVSCVMPLPIPTLSIAVTVDPLSSLRTGGLDTPVIDSPRGIFADVDKDAATMSAAQEATSVGGGETRGSSSGIADDGVRLIDDLFIPTVRWDPHAQDKRYQPHWKIAESSRLIFPPVVQHWVERAYPPAEAAYVEGLNNEDLMNSSISDSVNLPRRLVEIRRRWMHDNTQLHQARATIQELRDDKHRLESQLQTVGLREARFLSEKNKAEEDLRRVTNQLAEERILWARDMAEKDRVLAQAKNVQEELERKAIAEAQKVRLELSAQLEKFRVDTDFVSQVQERYQSLTTEIEASHTKIRLMQAELEEREGKVKELQDHCDSLVENALAQSNAEVDDLTSQLAAMRGDRNWLITNGLVGAFEYLRESPHFTSLIDRLSAAAYQYRHHDGVYKGYMDCHQLDRVSPDFHAVKGKLQTDMASALEAAYTEPLPCYGDLMDKVNEDGIESLRLMLDPAEEQRLSEIFRVLDAADGLLQLQHPVTRSMLRGRRPIPNAAPVRANRACQSIVIEDPQPVDPGVPQLSADVLSGLIPVNPEQRYRLTYQRHSGGRPRRQQVDGSGTVVPMVDGSSDHLAIDPVVVVGDEVVVHTPAVVMAPNHPQ